MWKSLDDVSENMFSMKMGLYPDDNQFFALNLAATHLTLYCMLQTNKHTHTNIHVYFYKLHAIP